MTNAELQAMVLKLTEENAKLREVKVPKLSMKVSEKGALSIYGLGRFPATLYKQQWRKVLAMAADIEAFIVAHDSTLVSKGE